ncbi:MAG: crotonase/enoyl-CoA hydratase family protein [Myxococcales bacterium]|nr:crotonase/enoyl-CoA hydratase family protein [Myxococcales bacterium]
MSYTCFDVDLSDQIAHIQFKRPEAFNSMVPEFWSELPEIVSAFEADGEARAIVISSTGKHFTAGMDLAVFGSGGPGEEAEAETGRKRAALRRRILELQESFSCLDRARLPVLAAVQGGCVGGGVDLISACDMRYCTQDAFFCIQEINIGMTADVGTFPRLPHILPQGLVRELAYTGRRLPAEEAREAGLVNRVYESHEALLAGVMEVAAEIAARSPLAVWGSKEMINYARDHSIADGLDYIATWQTGMFQPADMAEAFAAKKEKRAARYPDLLPERKKP